MNNFVALYFGKSSLDHGVWIWVVSFDEEEMRNELLIPRNYMCYVLEVCKDIYVRFIV